MAFITIMTISEHLKYVSVFPAFFRTFHKSQDSRGLWSPWILSSESVPGPKKCLINMGNQMTPWRPSFLGMQDLLCPIGIASPILAKLGSSKHSLSFSICSDPQRHCYHRIPQSPSSKGLTFANWTKMQAGKYSLGTWALRIVRKGIRIYCHLT